MPNNIYTRPATAIKMDIPTYAPKNVDQGHIELARPIMVDKGTECHVTPLKVAAEMFYLADIQPGHKVLEPSGGTGNLAFAIMDRGHDPKDITVIEKNWQLVESMVARAEAQMQEYPGNRAIDFNLIHADFLGWIVNGRTFDRIVMNPPFKAVKKHIMAAEQALKPGGVLVAIVPNSFLHPTALDLEQLGSNTFANAKVNTKIIKITN